MGMASSSNRGIRFARYDLHVVGPSADLFAAGTGGRSLGPLGLRLPASAAAIFQFNRASGKSTTESLTANE